MIPSEVIASVAGAVQPLVFETGFDGFRIRFMAQCSWLASKDVLLS